MFYGKTGWPGVAFLGKTVGGPDASHVRAERRANGSPCVSPEEVAAQPAFPQAIFLLASGLFEGHKTSPHSASLFATQQRWLLCHASLAHFFQPFDGVEPGLSRKNIGRLGPLLGIANRLTAYALFDEALKYGMIHHLEGEDAGHGRAAGPSSDILSLLVYWYGVHFQALDLLDGGQRCGKFTENWQSLLPLLQPVVAAGLLASEELRSPGPIYNIFTWADTGGWLMDRLIAGIDRRVSMHEDRYPTDIWSITALSQAVGLSRAHTSRKLAQARSKGGLGWSGRAGRSPLWISRSFYEEYARFQAAKLSILDKALAAVSADIKGTCPST